MRADVAARTAEAEKTGDVLKAKLAAARRDASTWRTVALRGIDEVAGLEQQQGKLRHKVDDRDRQIAALLGTVSWRVTRPLRVVRRLRRHDTESGAPIGPVATAPAPMPSALEVDDTTRWLTQRLTTATELLGGERTGSGLTVGEALQAFEEAVERSSARNDALAWLSFVTVMARYPTEIQFDRAARVLRAEGVGSLSRHLRDDLQEVTIAGVPVDRELVVAESRVLTEVGHSVTYDVHTGIQRVVRETVGRWLETHSLALCAFDYDGRHASLLASSEAQRLVSWKDHMHGSGAASEVRQPSWRSQALLVPWHSTLLLPELVAEPQRCDAYRALARSGVIDRLGVVGFDMIPITAFETVADGLAGSFANYLALVKYASAVSAISESSANDFASFVRMLSSQGLP
jgi:hypothetical protein